MSPFRHLSLLMLMSLIAVIGAQAQEPEPIGAEFQVNAYTTSGQSGADAATDEEGNFVVVWSGAGPGESSGVFGRRFDAAGVPLGIEFVVNSYTTYWQGEAAVAAAADGRFVVVWTSAYQDGDRTGVFAQRFDETGSRVGSEFQVNSSTFAYQQYPDVASDRDGNFLVVWWGYIRLSGIIGQLYDASGTPVGGEFYVDLDNFTVPEAPSVASDPNGTFVVAWQTDNYFGYSQRGIDVYARRYDLSGSLSGEFLVNTTTTYRQAYPSVGSAANGDFLVAWESTHLGLGDRIFARTYDGDGNPRGDEFELGAGREVMVSPAVTRDFVVVWEKTGEVAGRVVDAFGRTIGNQFQANTYTTGFQWDPVVAADPEGDFVVAWSGAGAEDPGGVFGQRFEGRLQIVADGACPGSVGLSVSNAPPGSDVAIVAAAETGSFVKGGAICSGTALGIGEPFALPPTFVTVDGEGNGFVERELPPNRCFLQALALADCSVSGVVRVPAVRDR